MTDTTADASVVVPALLDWHDDHFLARPATAAIRRLPAHVMTETFAVLTRLPRGMSLPPDTAASLLLEAFPEPPLTLDPTAHLELLRTLGSAGIRGGAVHDAVVGATAAQFDADLITWNRRAAAAYRAVGARFRAPGSPFGSR